MQLTNVLLIQKLDFFSKLKRMKEQNSKEVNQRNCTFKGFVMVKQVGDPLKAQKQQKEFFTRKTQGRPNWRAERGDPLGFSNIFC